jgi:serine/threonine-protein kinase
MMVTPSVKLVRPLGEGGMGAVWVADHLALRTQVVVKFIASGLTSNKEAQERFSREAAAASQVKSPHVVQTFDHGITDEGVPYIVMELLEGRDLGEYLEQHVKVPPELVVEILGQLSRALDRAHE